MSARDQLAAVLAEHNFEGYTMAYDGRESSTCQCGAPVYPRLTLQQHQAEVTLAAGYTKPKVLGYLVVSRNGKPIGEHISDRVTAQKRADEWTNDCRSGGIDWDYRVATITEAQS